MSAARARDDRRNLVLLTIDAWRPDFVDEHAGVPLTPSLRDVAARTVRFDRAYANGPWTTPALVSVFSGESPARHGVHFEWSAPRPGGPALARTLRDAGYCVPNLCYLNRLDNYTHLGFDQADAPDYPHSPADDLLITSSCISPTGRRSLTGARSESTTPRCTRGCASRCARGSSSRARNSGSCRRRTAARRGGSMPPASCRWTPGSPACSKPCTRATARSPPARRWS
jgi:hypothetical protein